MAGDSAASRLLCEQGVARSSPAAPTIQDRHSGPLPEPGLAPGVPLKVAINPSPAGARAQHYAELARFFIAQRSGRLVVPDVPWFEDDATVGEFLALLASSRFYLEYGAGGSTVAAARLGVRFMSVDTDRRYLMAVRRHIGPLGPMQTLLHADIGPTGLLGGPLRAAHAGEARRRKWAHYPHVPWRMMPGDVRPALVLVDGRFRVAAALVSARHLVARPHARLLVDDYAGRDHYRVLADFLDLRRMIGRMAEFTPLATPHPGLDQAILAHAADWR